MSRRVIRGGSWNNKPDNLRSANRNRNNTDNRNNNIGFRLAQYARQLPGAALFKDRAGVAAGVHEPPSRLRNGWESRIVLAGRISGGAGRLGRRLRRFLIQSVFDMMQSASPYI